MGDSCDVTVGKHVEIYGRYDFRGIGASWRECQLQVALSSVFFMEPRKFLHSGAE